MSAGESKPDWLHADSVVCWNEFLRDAVGRVSGALGPGFTESIYQHALAAELRTNGFVVEVERIFEINYCGQSVGFVRADLVVDGHAVLELKTVAKITDTHVAQLDAYMRQLTGWPRTGAVVNFGIHGGWEIKTRECATRGGVSRISDSNVGE